jgi:hypothetical protein
MFVISGFGLILFILGVAMNDRPRDCMAFVGWELLMSKASMIEENGCMHVTHDTIHEEFLKIHTKVKMCTRGGSLG